MIYFIHEFDRRTEISHDSMIQIYRRLAESWQKAWPSNHFIGLFGHRYGLGSGPQYMAIWELPNFAAFDEWRSRWNEVKGFMATLEDEFHNAVINEHGRVVERLLP